jgi:hypothetical protein
MRRCSFKDAVQTSYFIPHFNVPINALRWQKGCKKESRGEFMREVSLLNEGEKKGFFDREMHALLLLSLRSLPPEFKKL